MSREFKEPYQAYLDAIAREDERAPVDVQPTFSLQGTEVLSLELMPVQDDARSYTSFNRRSNAIISAEEKYIPFTVE